MPSVTLTFSAPLNVSCQVGDKAYYASTSPDGGFTKNDAGIVEIGEIRQITNAQSTSPTVTCHTTVGPTEVGHGTTEFILFSKDNKANLSSVLGYFASVKLVNNSTAQAELYSVSMDAFESSK
tara:strand:+ start:433 stop:801 length:369 start_codon:yes stop_codon:yes gene_type:complete